MSAAARLAASRPALRAGVDTGGTHTDLVLAGAATKELVTLKVPTSPRDLGVGAMHMGTRGWGTEIWQEGRRLPPLGLVTEGRLDENVPAIVLNNTRVPDTMENDLRPQLASVQAAREEFTALYARHGDATMAARVEALIACSERRTGAEIARIPDGDYTHEEPLLDDRAQGGPYRLRLKLVKRGTDLIFDFTGTDPRDFHGGHPGEGGRGVVNEGLPGERVLTHAIGEIEQLAPGDTVTHCTPGGGGYGEPKSRDPRLVQHDVRARLVSLAAAARVYGVRLDPQTLEILS
ncbi:MAG: hydantoinase B/oxoprolinase family protein [Burkholderiales bacterium]|nr:hydantoinase B/oxoprolinase family protein [Burkholderiales bacterium]